MQDFSGDIAALTKRLNEAEVYLSVVQLRERKPELEDAAAAPGLWDDPDEARKVTGELSAVADDLDTFDKLRALDCSLPAGSNKLVEIIDGIAPGEQVVVAGHTALKEKSPLEILK